MRNEYDYLNDVKMDFTCYEKERFFMRKRIVFIAACVGIFAVSTAFASGFVSNVIKTIKTGYNSFTQVDSSLPQSVPEELKGKLFDENGVPYEKIQNSDFENLYDKNGNRITEETYAEFIEEAFGGTVKLNDGKDINKKMFESLEEAQTVAEFDIKIPEYLPEEYELSEVYTYKDDDGSISGLYITFEYENSQGEKITFHERLLTPETAFEMGTDGTIEEITVNGKIAVMVNDSSIDFETDDSVSVGIYSHGNITKEELIKIAENIS